MKRDLTEGQAAKLDHLAILDDRTFLHEYIVVLHEDEEVTLSAIGKHFEASRQWAHKMYLKGKRNRANAMVDTLPESQ